MCSMKGLEGGWVVVDGNGLEREKAVGWLVAVYTLLKGPHEVIS